MKRLTAATVFGLVLIPRWIIAEDQTKDVKAVPADNLVRIIVLAKQAGG